MIQRLVYGVLMVILMLQVLPTQASSVAINNQPILDVCRIDNHTVDIFPMKKDIKPAFIKITRLLNGKTTILYHEYESGLWSYKIRDRLTNSQLAKYRIEIKYIGVTRPTTLSAKALRDCYQLYK